MPTNSTRPSQPFRLWLMILIGMVLYSACTPGTNLPWVRSSQSVQSAASVAITEVRFSVKAPLFEDGSKVFLEVLDEVTGLALNPTRYELKKGADDQYTITIPVTVGSVIKYRYFRQGDQKSIETTAQNSPVRYRMFFVSGAAQFVRDSIAGWSDRPYSGSTGRLVGIITEQESGEPIPGLMVTAAGTRTFSASDGSFILDGLPAGESHLLVYSLDGTYLPFQQGAVIAADSTTPAPVSMTQAKLVNVTFQVSPPSADSPSLPVRMIGNIYSLGNTFADLEGGFNTLASRAPLLNILENGTYQIVLQLPAGLDLRYKYTQGDGFWNAEQTAKGHFRVRQLIVPDQDTVINDKIDAWTVGNYSPVSFTVTVPEDTPADDTISIQFNPYGWTPPSPMWRIGENEWVFVLNNPLHLLGNTQYRYCRNEQCETAPALEVQGVNHAEFQFEKDPAGKVFEDQVLEWKGWEPIQQENISLPDTDARGEQFFAGVEFQPQYHPGWQPYLPNALDQVTQLHANWVVLTPTWSSTDDPKLSLEPLPGRDPLREDISQMVSMAAQRNLQVAFFPQVRFTGDLDSFLSQQEGSAPYSQWFEQYQRFVLEFADLAQKTGAQALILSEPGISKVLSATVPTEEIEVWWTDLITNIRSRYSGQLIWAMQLPESGSSLPTWAGETDLLYLEVAVPPTLEEQLSSTEAWNQVLEEQIEPIQQEASKNILLAVSIPSAEGVSAGCIQINDGCLAAQDHYQLTEQATAVNVALQEQADVYNDILRSANEHDWLAGFVSKGYYPPAAIQGPSASVRGKPASEVLSTWFQQLRGIDQ